MSGAPWWLKDGMILVQEAAAKQAAFGKTSALRFTKNLQSADGRMLGLKLY